MVQLTLVGGLLTFAAAMSACGSPASRPQTVGGGDNRSGGGATSPYGDGGTTIPTGTADASVPLDGGLSCTVSAGAACPAADLVGCCTTISLAGQSETCFYVGSTGPDSTAAACEAVSGSWSATQ